MLSRLDQDCIWERRLLKKTVSGIMLTLLLTSMLTLAFNIQTVKAEGTIYIRADGSIDPPTAPIFSSDSITYTLTGNINADADGILIQRDNIVLDGAGYTLQGGGGDYSRGIFLEGRDSVTVRNTQIKNFGMGIVLRLHSANNIISGNYITAGTYFGIVLDFSSNYNEITANIIANNGCGIGFYYTADYNRICGNSITNNGVGIKFYGGSYYNLVYHNNFVDNTVQAESEGIYGGSTAEVWDDGYPSGGNYWSDYAGVDAYRGPSQDIAGSDGIGDTPYTIDANNIDHYPLMKPWSSIIPNFEISVSPTSNVLLHIGGWNDSTSLVLKSLGGFSGTVQLSSSGPSDSNINIAFAQNPVYLAAGSQITVNMNISSTGSILSEYTLIVAGESDSISHELNLAINVIGNSAAINNLVTLQQISPSDPRFSIQQNFIVATPPSSSPFHDDFDNLNNWYERKFTNPNSDYSQVSTANSILDMMVPGGQALRNKINTTMTFKGDCLTVEVRFRVLTPQQDPNYAIFLYTDHSSIGAAYQELDWEYKPGSRGKQQIAYYYTDNTNPQNPNQILSIQSPWNSISQYSSWTTLKFALRPDHFSIYMNGQAIVSRYQMAESPLGGFTASNFYLIIETTNCNFPNTPRHLARTTSDLQVDSVNVDSSAMYWVQNIVTVGANIPIISRRLTSSVFRVYDMPEMGQPWQRGSVPNLFSAPVVFNLTSYIDGNRLFLGNNASLALGTASVSVSSGSYIVGYPGIIDGFTHQAPEIVVVGGPYQQTVTFLNPTLGTVSFSVELVGESSWRQTQNVILRLQNHPQTAEESRNLKWAPEGTFQYSSGSTDQGITFSPNYHS
jgi:hypothetical protein